MRISLGALIPGHEGRVVRDRLDREDEVRVSRGQEQACGPMFTAKRERAERDLEAHRERHGRWW